MCDHPGFVFKCEVSHLADTGSRVLGLSGSCSSCGFPVAFLGLPWMISTTTPCRDLTATTASLPIQVGERLDILEQGGECRVELPDSMPGKGEE